MLVLGIESSCDETACAIVKEGNIILSNIISSQVDIHEKYGGVVPELACRRHIDLILPVIDEALEKANVKLEEIDVIASTQGPGLIGALLIGLTTAKGIALALKKPFIGVNHIEAHLYAAIMSSQEKMSFPCLGVILSGGHTNLVWIKDIGDYEPIGKTIDDAIGEAFDKAAKMLGLPYPGGPEIERIAKQGDPLAYSFKAGQMKEQPLNFSFSGLKTALLYALQKEPQPIDEKTKQNLAASFQRAAFEDVIKKTEIACKHYNVQTILMGGGVTNSRTLRTLFQEKLGQDYTFIWPSEGLSLDNAAMIAGLGYHRYRRNLKGDSLSLEPLTRIPF